MWLNTYGGATGAIAGVLVADYWWIRRRKLAVADLYRSNGKYRYAGGWNWIAVVALLAGIVIAIGGSYTPVGTDGPFPANGIIPFLKDPFPFADYSWVVGLRRVLRALRRADPHRRRQGRDDRGIAQATPGSAPPAHQTRAAFRGPSLPEGPRGVRAPAVRPPRRAGRRRSPPAPTRTAAAPASTPRSSGWSPWRSGWPPEK